MRHPVWVTGSVTPPAPGRTPHSASRRAFGTTQPQAPQCWSARLRHDVCPGAEDPASRSQRAAGLRASGRTSREGGSEELTGGRDARR
jgi:hypothetical protein